MTLLAGVLVASLVGSLHCAGMCGVFVAMAVGGGDRKRLQLYYHGGRLVGYATLGAIAGLLGRALDMGTEPIGLSHTSAVLAAGMIVLVGGAGLAREAGVRLPRLPTPRWAATLFQRGARAAAALGRDGRALTIGLLTALLPCGWLYAFALVAAGTANPATGALVMAAFWIGTVPVLALIGWSAGSVRAKLGPTARVAASVLVITLGVRTLMRAADADLSGVREAVTVSETPAVPTGDVPCPLCATRDSEP